MSEPTPTKPRTRRSGRKAKSPAFQFYAGDYLTDAKILALSFEERGIWLHLICLAWLNGGLDPDLDVLARSCGLPRRDFDRAWRRLSTHFELRGDRLVNPRQEREREVQAENRARRSEAGKDGNAKRWGASSDASATDSASQCDRNAIANASPPSPVSRTPSIQEDPTGLPPLPPAAPVDPSLERPPAPRQAVTPESPPIPAALDAPEFREAWADWIRYRREMGAKFALKPTGAAQQLAQCARIGVERSVAALRHTMAMGWQGMREPEPVRGPLAGPRSAPVPPENSTRAWFEAQSREQPRTVDVEGRRTA